MKINQVENKCREKEDLLLNKYFGNLVKEAAVERHETIGVYSKGLPLRIEEEYYQYLKELFEELFPSAPYGHQRTINEPVLLLRRYE